MALTITITSVFKHLQFFSKLSKSWVNYQRVLVIPSTINVKAWLLQISFAWLRWNVHHYGILRIVYYKFCGNLLHREESINKNFLFFLNIKFNYIISFVNSLLRQNRSCHKNKVLHIFVACHFVDKFRRTKDPTHESVGVFMLHERRHRVSCRTMKLLSTRPS